MQHKGSFFQDQSVYLQGKCCGWDDKKKKYLVKLENQNVCVDRHGLVEVDAAFLSDRPFVRKGLSAYNKSEPCLCKTDKTTRYSHFKLQKLEIITDPRAEILIDTNANFNFAKLWYYIKRLSADKFEVTIKYQVRFGAKQVPFSEPTVLSLSDLRRRLEDNQTILSLTVGYAQVVTLNIFSLTRFLKSNF